MLNEFFNEVTAEILQLIVTVIAGLIAVAFIEVRKYVLDWIRSRTTRDQQDLLEKWAVEAFSYAETIYKDVDGNQKLKQAERYFIKKMNEKGIKVDKEQIRGLIETAVVEFNKQVKRGQP